MWIVRIALQRPLTFIVLAIFIVLLGIFSIARTPVDVLPAIRIPIIASLWSYEGLPPQDAASRLALPTERSAPLWVSDIEHSESQSLSGKSIIKFFFQPNVDEKLAYAEITGAAQPQVRQAPPGTSPPNVLAYDASTVPVIQLALSSNVMPEAQLFDLANNVVRLAFATISGAASPFPYGGAQRQVQVDLNPEALRAHNMSAADVSTALGAQTVVLPAGTQKIGEREYVIKLNAGVSSVEAFNDLPIRTVDGVTTYIRDVAQVRDGSPPQTNLVRQDGHHAVLMSVLKTGNASTLDVIKGVRESLGVLRSQLPDSVSIQTLGDQSVFVNAAVNGVLREGVIAALLTGLMILLFLGSWRSTLIIAISIPLAALASVVCLAALGETINIMTLGGLALAVGILVDDATVTVESIHRHLEDGKDLRSAILDGARQIAVPAFVSTLAICIVFVPMFFLQDIARFLFVPMAEAVVFAMLASYLLSRTLVPTLSWHWLRHHEREDQQAPRGRLAAFQHRFERGFERMRERYRALLAQALAARYRFVVPFLAAMAVTALLAFPLGPLPGLGQDFFPPVDGGQIKLHLRAPAGTRLESTAVLCDQVEALVAKTIPARDLDSITDNIGMPTSTVNIAYSGSAPVGPGDADILIALKEGHRPTDRYVQELRRSLGEQFPGVSFAFLPADIVNQILNFGQPAPMDVQVAGTNLSANRAYTQALFARLQAVPGIADARIQQSFDFPEIDIEVDRTRAQVLGLSQQNVAGNLLIALSGSQQTAPSFFLDPRNNTQYSVTVQAPQYRLNSLDALGTLPITSATGGSQQLLANLATFHRSAGPAVVSHYNGAPVLDIYAGVANADLGFVSDRVRAAIDATRAQVPRGTQVSLRGQAETMRSSFNGLLLGLAGAVVLVYLLIVVNFQSWLDPLIIISALPAALAGIVWMLFLSHTSVSVPALTGAIMCMGVATANSILVVSFARERLDAGDSPHDAALDAGHARLRPVLMTALAMILGMLPMALGLGEGGEQNAPLGRAVIGGLIFATAATLLFVPSVFALFHGRRRPTEPDQDESMTGNNMPVIVPGNDGARGHITQRALWVLLAVALLLAAWGVGSRLSARATLVRQAASSAGLVVTAERPRPGDASSEIVLPATLQPFMDAPVYARTSGYLRRWLVDIGAHVRKGQLLAEIDSPEVDQQLHQAQADLAVAEANSKLAHSTAGRWQDLLAKGAVSRQDVDDKVGDAEAKAAEVASARANLQRLQQLASFERITSPFDGVVTARRTDVGALIAAGTGAGTSGELFHVAAADKLRVYVNVPQAYAGDIHIGQRADVRLSEQPDRARSAVVVSTADSIDPASRTMLVQMEMSAADSTLLAGTYVEVHLKVANDHASLRVPSNSLLYRNDALSVVTVTADQRMKVVPVTVGRDFGTEIEILTGIRADDQVIVSPPESAGNGMLVRVRKAANGNDSAAPGGVAGATARAR